MYRSFIAVLFLALVGSLMFAQAAQPQAGAVPKALNPPRPAEYVAMNFGPSFSIIDKFPMLVADLDGDGTEDAIFVLTRTDNPLLDEAQFHYKVIDPYDEYFGFGDPRVTIQFNANDPELMKYIAIVHNWRAATAKAKFIVINMPFEKLTITRTLIKKKPVTVLAAEELGGLGSMIYWDGKKYRWETTGAPN